MKKIELSEKDYANICLNCPYPRCIMDATGQCDRVRPYRTDEKRRYETSESEELKWLRYN